MSLRNAVIVDAIRTPIGRYAGGLKNTRPDDLAVLMIKSLLDKNKAVPHDEIDDVIFGCTNQGGEDSRNVARMAVLLSGLPDTVPGLTVNRLCASGLDAVNHAAACIAAGIGDIYIAGGVESMTRAPLIMAKASSAYSRTQTQIFDSTIGWRFVNPKMAKFHEPIGMGLTAENVARRYGVSREDQDAFAYSSQMKWKKAHDTGAWKNEIIPVSVPQKKGSPVIFDTDEHPRPETTLSKLAKLKPAFSKDGTVTAGNSSGINDGASALLVMSEKRAIKLGLAPLARVVSLAQAGVSADYMGIGPIPATQKALEKAGLNINDIGIVELNEAFASQSIVCQRELEIDPALCNLNGGAIAMGHPLGCSGARIMTTLLHLMKKNKDVKYGLTTMCVGAGQGVATIIENCG